MKLIISCIVAGGFAAVAAAQSYNIDFGGAGTNPSAGYAAAGLPGEWNTLGVPTPGTHYPLVNLQGVATGVTLNNIGGTQLLATDDPATSRDDDALMDDMLIGFNNPVDVCIWVRNLPVGPYEVRIYAMTPNNPALMSQTRVDFADQGPTWIGGAWPGTHQLGVTYSRHTVTTNDGIIGLHSGVFGGNFQSGINGIQIRPIHAGDVNGDAVVNIDDLLGVINGWGACPANPPLCAADITGNGTVDIDDLLAVINNWG
jgi:hypothetical protein